MKDLIYDVIVIGAGPAGVSAAIWCKRLNMDVLLLDKGEKPGGQLFRVGNPIIDYPGLWTEQGEDLALLFSEHVRKMNIPLQLDQEVLRVDGSSQSVVTSKGTYFFKYLILATGVRDRRLNIPGEEGLLQQKEQYSTTRAVGQFAGSRVLIVGGGDRALEGALNISHVAEHTWLIHRGEAFRARDAFAKAVERDSRITVWTEAQLKEICHQDASKIARITREDGDILLPVDKILIRIGMEPDISLVLSQVKTDSEGYIAVDGYFRTSIPWLFAIGDCITRPEYRSISLAVGQGMVASKAIVKQMTEEQR